MSLGKAFLFFCGALLLLFVVAAFNGRNAPGADERRADRETIEKCRLIVDDELQELSMRRLMRTHCIKLESEFREKWNLEP